MMDLPDDQPIKRWTAQRRSALVMSLLCGEKSVQEAARSHGLTVAEVEEWRDRFLFGAEKRCGQDPATRRPSRTRRSTV